MATMTSREATQISLEKPYAASGCLQDEFVLAPRNEHTLYGYWAVTRERIEKAAERLGGRECREVIRLTWSAQSLFDLNFIFWPVSFASNGESLRVPFSGLAYTAELGWIDSEGNFISLLSSNESRPRTPESKYAYLKPAA